MTTHHFLTIPAELRLKIYEYLLPLDTACGDLKGLVLSCRLIKKEMYYEMRKRVQDIQTTLEQRWPFTVVFTVVFPRRTFKAKDIIIDVPYLPEGVVSLNSVELGDAWDLLCRRNGLALPVVRMTLRIGNISGNPKFDVKQSGYPLYYYMRKLSYKYYHISVRQPQRAKEVEIRYKDGQLAFGNNVAMLIVNDKGVFDEVHPQDIV